MHFEEIPMDTLGWRNTDYFNFLPFAKFGTKQTPIQNLLSQEASFPLKLAHFPCTVLRTKGTQWMSFLFSFFGIQEHSRWRRHTNSEGSQVFPFGKRRWNLVPAKEKPARPRPDPSRPTLAPGPEASTAASSRPTQGKRHTHLPRLLSTRPWEARAPPGAVIAQAKSGREGSLRLPPFWWTAVERQGLG